MSAGPLHIKADDLDEASIFFYRLWAHAELGVHPAALVLKEPEYVVVGTEWVLFASRTRADVEEVNLIAQDTGLPVICAAPSLGPALPGLDVATGRFSGPDSLKRVVEVLARSARELPPASVGRDPLLGRWHTTATGAFEIWNGRQRRLICSSDGDSEFGYTWEATNPQGLFFFRSKSCKRQGKQVAVGSFKLSEQKRERGSYWNLDLAVADQRSAALLHLTPVGAGYKVFARQLPSTYTSLAWF